MHTVITSVPRRTWEEIHDQPSEVSGNKEPLPVGVGSERIVQLYAFGSRYDPSAAPDVADIVGKIAPNAPWQTLKEKVTLPFIGAVLATPFVGVRTYGCTVADSLILVTD